MRRNTKKKKTNKQTNKQTKKERNDNITTIQQIQAETGILFH
jgi:hypothetical protein